MNTIVEESLVSFKDLERVCQVKCVSFLKINVHDYYRERDACIPLEDIFAYLLLNCQGRVSAPIGACLDYPVADMLQMPGRWLPCGHFCVCPEINSGTPLYSP